MVNKLDIAQVVYQTHQQYIEETLLKNKDVKEKLDKLPRRVKKRLKEVIETVWNDIPALQAWDWKYEWFRANSTYKQGDKIFTIHWILSDIIEDRWFDILDQYYKSKGIEINEDLLNKLVWALSEKEKLTERALKEALMGRVLAPQGLERIPVDHTVIDIIPKAYWIIKDKGEKVTLKKLEETIKMLQMMDQL